MIKAKDCKCIGCGKQAIAFYPYCDPDIPSHPYCKECLETAKAELYFKLMEIDEEYYNRDIQEGLSESLQE